MCRIVNARIRHIMTSPNDLFKLAVYGFSDFAKSVTYFCDFTTYDGFEIVERIALAGDSCQN